MTQHAVSLTDKYDLGKTQVLLNGTQALIRLMLAQKARDVAAGLNTAGYCTGYRGSPLGAVDFQMRRAEKELLASLSLLEIDSSEKSFLNQVRDAKGCPRCQNLGYRGRVGIFELMRMSDSIHSLVIKSASAPDIREVALKEGMSTLQGSGWQQIKRGLTTIDEVIRYADGPVEEQS